MKEWVSADLSVAGRRQRMFETSAVYILLLGNCDAFDEIVLALLFL